MMIPPRMYWLLLSMMILSACTATGYGPAGEVAGFDHGGYTDQRIDNNTYVVTFRGNSQTGGITAFTYLLYRCAQVTQENGYDYFIITSSSNSLSNSRVIEQHITSNNGVTFPPKLYNTYYYPDQYAGMVTTNTAAPGIYPQQHGAVATIKMFSGRAPAHTPKVYYANDVIARLGPAAF